MSDPKLQQIADSALLRVLQYVVTAVAMPLCIYVGGRVIDQLDRIQTSVIKSERDGAMVELRLQALERSNVERDTTMRLLTEKTMRHDYELQERRGGRAPGR